jgi:very-short-patch-repair endonuclease
MHSRKANKREVLKSLEQALRFSGVTQVNSNIPTKLAACRDKLNQWSSAIHKPIGETGRTVFQVIGRQVKLRNDGVRLLDTHLNDAAAWSATKLLLAETIVERAAEGIARITVAPKDHAWFGTDIDTQSPFDLDRLLPRLDTALETLGELSAQLKGVFPIIVDDRMPTIADAVATAKAFRHVAAVPKENRSILENRAWVRELAAIETAIESGKRFAVSISKIQGHFNQSAWTSDADRLLLVLRTDGASFLRRFGRRYRDAIAELRAISRSKPPKSLNDRIAFLQSLKKAQDDRREFNARAPLLSSALGSIWAEHKTPWAEIQLLAGWTRIALSELGGSRLLTIVARTQQDLGMFSAFADKIAATSKATRLALDELQKHVRANIQVVFGCEDYDHIPIVELSSRISSWRETVDAINDWVSVRNSLSHLRTEGLGIMADQLADGSIQPKEARPITDLLIAESLWSTVRGHYDRGGTRCDLVQAEEVAKAVAQHIKHYPNKSLGVACLSVQQRNAVDDMIDKLGIRTEVEGFTPKGERLFVKNLEAVQGDERDVIFISVGYGVAPNQSKPFLNFGPVSKEGGERRLNVLASRARERCVIYSSITAADIPADSDVRGTRTLRALLHFAETGKLSAGTLGHGGFESPFEEAVARAIREAGFHVYPQVGVKGFRIDLGVIDPAKPGDYILGVECDGATYHSARSARDRDRLRQEVLEGLGWRLHRIWSTDWFHKPQRESSKLLAAITDAKTKTASPSVEVVPDDELPETDVQLIGYDSLGEPVPSNSTEEPDLPLDAAEYEECALAVPVRRDLLELSVLEISRLALVVVEAEGPIHTDEVARRIREAFGLQKTGKRILARVRSGLIQLSRGSTVVRDGEFWSAAGHEIQFVRNRRKAALPLRRAAMIAPAEYRLALSTIISDAVAISRDDLIIETARLFGFDRTGPDLREAIDRQAAKLVKAGQVYLEGNLLRLPVNRVVLQ